MHAWTQGILQAQQMHICLKTGNQSQGRFENAKSKEAWCEPATSDVLPPVRFIFFGSKKKDELEIWMFFLTGGGVLEITFPRQLAREEKVAWEGNRENARRRRADFFLSFPRQLAGKKVDVELAIWCFFRQLAGKLFPDGGVDPLKNTDHNLYENKYVLADLIFAL